jgi:hypothetical protein
VTPRRAVLAFPLAVAIVVAFALPAFATPGDLDPTFSGDGKVRVGISGGVADVAIQPDGRIVAVGTGGGAFAILRLNRDGTLDHSFSGDGVAHISTGPGRRSSRMRWPSGTARSSWSGRASGTTASARSPSSG